MEKCKCGTVLIPAEAATYGRKCELCWLEGSGVDVRGPHVNRETPPKGNSSQVHSPKEWPKLLGG